MSLPSTDPRVAYVGNNSTGTYPWTWLVYEASDLHVAVLSGEPLPVLTVLTLGTDYTIQNSNLQIGNSNGGNIVLTSTGFFAHNNGILPTGYAMVIRRSVVFQQDTTLTSQGLYDPASIEGALDFLAMQTIQLQDAMARCVQMPLDDYAAPAQNVSVASIRAGQLLGFDNAGNPINVASVLTGILATSLGAQVVQAATLAALQTILGGGPTGISLFSSFQPQNIPPILAFVAQCTGSTISGSTQTYTGMNLGQVYPLGSTILWACPSNNTEAACNLVNGTFGTNSILNKDGSATLSTSPPALVAGTFYLLAFDGIGWRIMA